jgi:hypothetical protein
MTAKLHCAHWKVRPTENKLVSPASRRRRMRQSNRRHRFCPCRPPGLLRPSKGLQVVLGNPGAAHPLVEVGHAYSQRPLRSNLTVRHGDHIPRRSTSRRTFRHGGLSSQSLSSFDDFDDLARARVNHNGPVVDHHGAVFCVGDFMKFDSLGQG